MSMNKMAALVAALGAFVAAPVVAAESSGARS